MAERASTLKVEVLGDASKLRKELDGISGRMKKFGQGVSRAGGTLMKFVSGPIAGAVGAVGALAKKEGERADALLDAEAATGTSTETLQEYQHVAKQAGVNQEFFSEAAKDAQRQLSSASDGTGRAAEAFDALGVKTHDANGNLRESGEVTQEAMEKLAGIEDEGKRAAIAQDIFKGSSQEMLAVVGQGADEIKRQRDEAHELGAVQSQDALEGANKFRQGLEKLSTRLSGLLSQIGGKFAPLLSDHLMPLFENKIAPALEGVADKVAGLVDWFVNLDPKVQGLIAGAVGLVAALGPVLLIVGKIITVMGALVPVIGAVASPIGLVVIAVGALVAGLVLAYRRSERFRDIVDSVFSWFRQFVPQAVEFVRRAIAAFVAGVQAAWDRWGADIMAIARAAWDAVSAIVTRVVTEVQRTIAAVTAAIRFVWERWGDDILAFASRTWDNIKTVISGVLDVIRGVFETFAGLFSGDWDRMWAGIKRILAGVVTFLEGLWDQFLNTLGTLARIGLDALARVWRSVWTAIKDWASDRVDDVVGFVASLPGRAKSALSSAWSAYQEFWQEAWEGVRDFVSDRVDDVIGFVKSLPRKARTALVSAWSTLRDGVESLVGGVKDWISDRIDDIVGFFTDLPGRILRGIGNIGSKIKEKFSFGFSFSGEAGGPGDGAMPPGGSVISRLNSFMDSTGIPHRTTSTFRPGDSGYHGQGRAVDFAGRRPGRNTPNLRAIQRAWVPLAASGKLKELIGPDASMNYKNGRQFPYSASTQAAHDDHVHTAMAGGGTIREHIYGIGRSGRTYEFGEAGPEDVVPRRGGDSASAGGSLERAIREQNELLRELVGELGRPNVTLQSTGDLGDDAQHARLAFMRG